MKQVGAACVNRHHWIIQAQWRIRMNSIFGHRLLQAWFAVATRVMFLSNYEENTAK